MNTKTTNSEVLLQNLKADIKKTLLQNNGRLTQEQIQRLCQYKRMVTSDQAGIAVF